MFVDGEIWYGTIYIESAYQAIQHIIRHILSLLYMST